MTSAIIVAAGRGTRMGPNIDKLFLEVSGAPVVAHTWERFDEAESIDEIVLVIRDSMQKDFEELATTLELQKPYRFATGGKERQDSV
jgi:2-C-methyl-D-erythritol 4-phosphate cytidylyltransferase